MANSSFCETFRFLSKTGFLSHNSASRYARKLIKSSKDADFGLVSKQNLIKKYGSLGWGPGPGKFTKNCKNILSLWRHLQKTQNVKGNINFLTCNLRITESPQGLNCSLAQSAGDLWPSKLFKSCNKMWRTWDWKRHVVLYSCSIAFFKIFAIAQMRKCLITVRRSCWLLLKNFQTLHELSRWRTKQSSLFSKPLQKF